MSDKKRCKSPEKEDPEKNKFTCEKCGRTANKEKHLCKPKKN